MADIFELTDEERTAERLFALRQSLHDTLREMEHSELVAESLGEHIFEWFLRNKRSGGAAPACESRRSRSSSTCARCEPEARNWM